MVDAPLVTEADIAVPDYVSAAVADASRTDADRVLDPFRKPEKLFAFAGIKPGFRVGELMCASGYNVGVMSPLVGAKGIVFGQNSPLYLERFGDRLIDRIRASRLTNVKQIIADMEHPGFPTGLDAVLSSMVYHDAVWMGMDRPAMNRAVLDCLSPGGIFCVVDHEAADYDGPEQVEQTHRIPRQFVIDDISAAGFEFIGEADIYSNPNDDMEMMVFNKKIRHHTQKFALKFQRPI